MTKKPQFFDTLSRLSELGGKTFTQCQFLVWLCSKEDQSIEGVTNTVLAKLFGVSETEIRRLLKVLTARELIAVTNTPSARHGVFKVENVRVIKARIDTISRFLGIEETRRTTDVPSTRAEEVITAAPVEKPTLPQKKPAVALVKPPKGEGKSTPVWEAYAAAMEVAYGNAPKRDAKTNAILCRIVEAVGPEDAINVVRAYVANKNQFYTMIRHRIDQCLKDVQGIRLEYLSGSKMTLTAAKQADVHQAIDSNFDTYIEATRGMAIPDEELYAPR